MGDFQEKIIGGTYGKGNQVISPEAVVSNTFLADYFRAAEKYAQYNTRNNYGSSSYRKHTTVKPYGLQRTILDTYRNLKKKYENFHNNNIPTYIPAMFLPN